MSNIFELTNEYRQLLAMMEDPEIDEQAVADTMEGIEMEIEQKADNYAWMIRSLDSNNEAIDKEIARLQALKKRNTNFIGRLKENLMFSMRAIGKEKFKTALNSFGIRKAGGKAPLILKSEDPLDCPNRFQRCEITINKDALRDAIDHGDEEAMSFAWYGERSEYLSIR